MPMIAPGHTEDGGTKAEGWKWEQGDWKAGCDFDMTGKVTGAKFVSDEKRKNPDTLERDHASLIVNCLDDVFAKSATAPKAMTSRNAGATTRIPRQRGCFRQMPHPTSTISGRSGNSQPAPQLGMRETGRRCKRICRHP
jgi:hypothetical protein